jgi:competence protein ComGC
MQKNKLTFSKAPSYFEGLQERANSFFELKKPVTNYLTSMALPIDGLDTLDSLSGYLTKDFLYAEAGLKDEATAKTMLNNIEKFKNDFYAEQTKNYDEAKSEIYTASLESLFEDIGKMYGAAKNKDIVNHLKISQKGCSIIIAQPCDKDDKLVIATAGIGFLAAAAIPNFKAAKNSARGKACFSNQRVLIGAVEMYNMDHDTMMSNLDIPTLVKEGYLKETPNKPDPDCDYFSKGDLATDGIIFCKKHGSIMQQQ